MNPPPKAFSQMVLLDRTRHRARRLRPATSAHPATGQNAVFVAAAEFGQACKSFPVVFVRTGERDAADQPVITPVCLLGLQDGENLFVGLDGRWTGDYEPAFLRRHPFAMVDVQQPDGQTARAVAFDASWDGLSDEGEGDRLFGDDGEPAPALKQALQLLDDFEVAVQATRPIGAHLQALGLLKDMRAAGTLADGTPFAVDGFFVVDEDRLKALPDATVLQLFRNGLLGVVHAHLVSLDNLAKLVDRKSARRGTGS